MHMRWDRLKKYFDVVTGLAIIVLAGSAVQSTWWQKSRTTTSLQRVIAVPPTEIQLSDRALRQPGAKAAVIEFADFECPFCRRFARNVLPELMAHQSELRIDIDFRHRPLDVHRNAVRIAVAAQCANNQRKFWQMHDALFAEINGFEDFDPSRYARTVGFDATRMAACTATSSESVLADDYTQAKRFDIAGTPSFLVGTVTSRGTVSVTRKLVGAQTVEQIRGVIRELQ